MAAICPDSKDWYMQMATMRLPQLEAMSLKEQLYQEFKIEVPIIRWQGKILMRVSFQGYNTQADADALVSAMEKILNC
jgi:isopenicillin-N epimerase